MTTKKTKFLDFHPEAPKPPRAEKCTKVRQPRKPRQPRQPLNQNQPNFDAFTWQLEWINSYDALKKESNEKIEHERKRCIEKESVINTLKENLVASKEKIRERNEQIPRLIGILDKRKQKIRELKVKLKEIKKKQLKRPNKISTSRL